MKILVTKAEEKDIPQFKRDIQQAFQKGFEAYYGETEGQVLPEKDIDMSMTKKGAITYKAVLDGKIAGGAIVVINEETGHNELDLLYVKYGEQTKGVGHAIWSQIEKLHPETKVWETCTPYFEKRNIHFYLSKCGFHIIKYCKVEIEGFIGDGGDGMFVFQKRMDEKW